MDGFATDSEYVLLVFLMKPVVFLLQMDDLLPKENVSSFGVAASGVCTVVSTHKSRVRSNELFRLVDLNGGAWIIQVYTTILTRRAEAER